MYFKARAKLNLTLNVLGRRDGMHLLESVILPVDIYDDVEISVNDVDEIRLRYEGRDDLYDNDTALKAAELIKARYGTKGVDIFIRKRIPERAGLGGSSADAAAVARGMAELFGIEIDDKFLLSVGSDVPAMKADVPCILGGLGEKVSPIEVRYPNVVVMLIDGGVDTGACYRKFDETGGETGDLRSVVEGLKEGRDFLPFNALTRAAISLNPAIGEGLRIMRRYFRCSMTGSGSAIFGTEYDDEAFGTKVDELKKAVGGKYEIISLSRSDNGEEYL